jgi:acyl-CoA synthetase (AMP-forming)/AMP-acid ligase II
MKARAAFTATSEIPRPGNRAAATNWGRHRQRRLKRCLLLVDEVAEAAVVPAKDEIKGKLRDLYVALKPGLAPSEAIRKRVEDSVIHEIGAIARPRRIVIVPDMPRTLLADYGFRTRTDGF